MDPKEARKQYETELMRESLSGIPPREALNILGNLVNISSDLDEKEGFKKSLSLAETIDEERMSEDLLALKFHFVGNPRGGLRSFQRNDKSAMWSWTNPEAENEILSQRKAMGCGSFQKLSPEVRSSVLVNLANALDFVGRSLEALEYLDLALELSPKHAMALGNKGSHLNYLSNYLYDGGHAMLLCKAAHDYLYESLNLREQLFSEAIAGFESAKAEIEKALPQEYLQATRDMDSYPLGSTKSEQCYRSWCLENCLFLNPLNNLGGHSIAATDVMHLPSMRTPVGKSLMGFVGLFNQLKQEYTSARYFLFEGDHRRTPHFSDREVLVINTLDYPSYGLSSEMLRIAFRSAYSLFDRIAYFLVKYFKISIPDAQISFKTLWFQDRQGSKGLRNEIPLRNLPLRGLFWLAKDLSEKRKEFRSALQPDAQDLADLRNALEHRYVKIHDMVVDREVSGEVTKDDLAASVTRDEFEKKTLRLIKTARAAIMYLSMSVLVEEGRRKGEDNEKGEKGLILPFITDTYEDDWKR